MNKEELKIYLNKNKGKAFTGLLGSPVAHSLSPFIHNKAFEALGMEDREYIAVECLPEELSETISILKDNGFTGFNLTMPDKQAVIEFCDTLSDEAELIESVNTVRLENGKLKGFNTDCDGFFKALRKNGAEPENKRIMLLGAGGAAKAILTGAITNKTERIDVFSRPGNNFETTDRLIERLEAYQRANSLKTSVNLYDLSDEKLFEENLVRADILVNATNVGMDISGRSGDNTEKSLVKRPELLSEKQFAADIIYHPMETKLLKDAANQGCKTMNGIYMLFYQADLGFHIWHGVNIPDDVLRQLVLKQQ